jgi:hypothetical protein
VPPCSISTRAGTLRPLDSAYHAETRYLANGTLPALLGSAAHFTWCKRGWPLETSLGTDVYVAPALGPAIVGLLRLRIAIPRWLLSAPASHQEAVITHERSHLEARDTQHFTAALYLLLFMPWNLALGKRGSTS